MGCFPLSAAPFDTADPTSFFTNVAARLLRTELNLDLNRLQIYPTNQYTPAVHRLLQVTANLYDSTVDRTFNATRGLTVAFPSVFRPFFRRTSTGEIVIAGYHEVTNAVLAGIGGTAPAIIDFDSPDTNAIQLPAYGAPYRGDSIEEMAYGVPLIIGAKKGLPNFNEFSMQTYVYVSRLLEFRRDPSQPPQTSPIVETNLMYVLTITNTYGLEAWNSYSNPNAVPWS